MDCSSRVPRLGLLLSLGGLIAVFALGGGTAYAASVSQAAGALTLEADDREANRVTITFSVNAEGRPTATVTDAERLKPSGTCSYSGQGNRKTVACVAPAGVPLSAMIDLRDENDTLSIQQPAPDRVPTIRILDGPGNDSISASAGRNTFVNGPGNDTYRGGDGVDVAMLGYGNDTIHGGGGSDRLSGGIGNDRLWGGDGADTVNGSLGIDRVYGDSGNDLVLGGAGNDVLFGGLGRDRVFGGPGLDRMYGGPDLDRLDGRVGEVRRA